MLAGIISKISSGVVEFISYFTLSRWGVKLSYNSTEYNWKSI